MWVIFLICNLFFQFVFFNSFLNFGESKSLKDGFIILWAERVGVSLLGIAKILVS